MTDKEKIREKIEKRYEYWKEKEFNSHSIESEIRMSECQHLLLMIDSLQEEPVSEYLENAASSFARKDSEGINNPANFYYTVADKARIFKAGANWQKKKDEASIEGHNVYKKGKQAGMRYMKQLMMKDAVDAFVYRGGITLKEWPLSGARIEKTYPIKLIIIKQEEE